MTTPLITVNATILTDTIQGGNSGYALFIVSSGGQHSFTLPNNATFLAGSTFVYVSQVYQSFTSYIESTDGTTIILNNSLTPGTPVEVRYIQAT